MNKALKGFSILIILLETFSDGLLLSQPALEWVRRYPDTTNDFRAGSLALTVDSAGNVYVTGYAEETYSSWHGYCTIKYSASGLRLWTAIYRGIDDGGRYAYAIAVDKSGNVYVTGYSYEYGRVFDYCTIKYNSNGIQQWVQLYNGPSNGIDQATSIAIDNAQNIYVTGFSAAVGEYGWQVATIKYAPDGRELWVRRYGQPTAGTGARDMKIDDSCNIYITGVNGYSSSTMKYDSSGSQIWVQEYYGVYSNSLSLDKNNNVYIAGAGPCTQCYSDFYTIKYSSAGIQQWVRRYNPDSLNNGAWYSANSIAADTDGNAYVSGFYSYYGVPFHICVIKYSSDGDLIWANRDTDTCGLQTYMDIDKNNNIYIGAAINKSSLHPFFGTKKYDSSGVLQWERFYNDTTTDARPRALKVDDNFNVYLTGYIYPRMCTIKYSQLVGIQPIFSNTPNKFKLYQNYPNPFNATTKFNLQIPKLSYVKVTVYDILGKETDVLINSQMKPGMYEVQFDGGNLPSGIYFCKLQVANSKFQIEYEETRKVILLR